MNREALRALLERVRSGKTDTDTALEELRALPYEDLGFAKVDHHRALRTGAPEVVFAPGKSASQIVEVAERLVAGGHNLLITRIDEEKARAVADRIPGLSYDPDARLATKIVAPAAIDGKGTILVVSAGTSDYPVAEEAAVTATLLGNEVKRLYDVGVAGLHRLLGNRHVIFSARVLIVVAGMEGALPSVVAGMVKAPVIAVPTSIGYGSSFGGLAALLAMLNSCAAGVTVVNIDNGFGAGIAASAINHI